MRDLRLLAIAAARQSIVAVPYREAGAA